MGLKEQIVVVTGGTRGIGRAISLRLAREGPRCVVVAYYSNHEAARSTVREIEALGVEAAALATDVGDPKRLEELFQAIGDRYGRLDVFVSNAARTSFRPVMDVSPRAWNRIIELNAQAFLMGAQLAALAMRKSGGGCIVGISSLGSQRCVPDYAALGASKAAMECLARYLACELAPWNINVNVISAGHIDTETTRSHPDFAKLSQQIIARTPAGRFGRPEDVAGVVAFLCSPESAWIRGQTLVVDGGFSLLA